MFCTQVPDDTVVLAVMVEVAVLEGGALVETLESVAELLVVVLAVVPELHTHGPLL